MTKKQNPKPKKKPEQTGYANTDLMIAADAIPTALKSAFERHEYYDLWERESEEGRWEGSFETARQHKKPNPNIADFLSVIETFDAAELSQWQACTEREFDLGYHAGMEPFSFSQPLSEETIRRIAAAGAALRITIYAPEKPKRSQSTKQLRRKRKKK